MTTKEECKVHAGGIWLAGVCYCGGCHIEMVDATETCRKAVKAVLDAMAIQARTVDKLQCAEFMEGFNIQPALVEFARTHDGLAEEG